MFLFWRDKNVLPEMREIILAHLFSVSIFIWNLRKVDVYFAFSVTVLFSNEY